jgi:hypothetical protein
MHGQNHFKNITLFKIVSAENGCCVRNRLGYSEISVLCDLVGCGGYNISILGYSEISVLCDLVCCGGYSISILIYLGN